MKFLTCMCITFLALLLALPPVARAQATPTPTVTVNPTHAACVGNCDGNPAVTIDELVLGVRVALGTMQYDFCPQFDQNTDGRVTVEELVTGVMNALYGCGVSTPTRTPTATRVNTYTPSATPTFTGLPRRTKSKTQTPTITLTPTKTHTKTPTPFGVDSVCGGFVTTIPKLCDVTVMPNPVPLGGQYQVYYCLSDLEGDVNRFCLGIQTSPQEPLLDCAGFPVPGELVNECTLTPPIRFTNPAGNYTAYVEFRDRAGNVSNTAMAPFQVR